MKTKSFTYFFIAALAILMLSIGCNRKEGSRGNQDTESTNCFNDPHCCQPINYVFFVGCDGISDKEVRKLADDFEKNFTDKQWDPFIVEVLSHTTLPDSCLNNLGTRLSAKKVINLLNSKYSDTARHISSSNNEKGASWYIIGVTNRDIATAIHGKPDYGILGLSYLHNGSCSIISTYRLKRKSDLWKLATHEFCHGFYGCPHCPDDDPHCLMCDAKGGNPHFEIKDSLCNTCGSRCVFD